MPHLSPFHAALFTPSARSPLREAVPSSAGTPEARAEAADISSFLAPTYDQVDDEVLAALLRANPANAVTLDAPHGYAGRFRRSPQDASPPKESVTCVSASTDYHSARERFDRLVLDRAITIRSASAFYIVRQTFQSPRHHPHRRHALLGTLPAVPAGAGASGGVFGHETTETVTVDDRLALLKALEVQTSPVFGLYRDRNNTVEDWMRERMIDAEPIRFGVGLDGTLHELWEVDDDRHIRSLISRFGERPVVIADGHNRFNAAVEWSRQRFAPPARHPALTTVASASAESIDVSPAAPCVFALVAEQDPGMRLLPVHRVYYGIRDWSIGRFREAATGVLRVDPVDGPLEQLLDHVAQARYEGSHAMGVYDFRTSRCFVSTTVDIDPLAATLSEAPAAWRQSDPVLCEHLINHGILRQQMNGGRMPGCHRIADLRVIRRGAQDDDPARPQLAILLMPLSISDVFDMALSRHLLPPNSTHFVPKFASGLVMLPMSRRWSTA